MSDNGIGHLMMCRFGIDLSAPKWLPEEWSWGGFQNPGSGTNCGACGRVSHWSAERRFTECYRNELGQPRAYFDSDRVAWCDQSTCWTWAENEILTFGEQ